MAATWAARVIARRYVRANARANDDAQLLLVTRDGDVIELGAYTPDELALLASSHRIAYRHAVTRDERSRVARSRNAAMRLGQALRTRVRKDT